MNMLTDLDNLRNSTSQFANFNSAYKKRTISPDIHQFIHSSPRKLSGSWDDKKVYSYPTMKTCSMEEHAA